MSFALVTGASAGIGLQISKIFARHGHDLVLVARRKDKLQALAETIRQQHGRTVHVVSADLGTPGAGQQVYDAVHNAGVHIDYLVNNAGLGSSGAFIELSPEREMEIVQVNIAALVQLTRLFLPAMVARKGGRVLNIASTAAFQPGPFMATYYASKAFVLSFSEAIAHELSETEVTVTAHCPGATATEFADEAKSSDTNLFTKVPVSSAAEVAEHAYQAMMDGERVAVHGALNKLGAFSVRFMPRPILTTITSGLNSKS